MFDWLREIRDVIKAEWDLATANPSQELCDSVGRAMHNKDAKACAAIEDSMSWLGHGRILGDMEAAGLSINDPVDLIASKIGYSEDQIRETIEAQKIVNFLRGRMYETDQIVKIGNISRSLQKNNGDIMSVIKDMNTSEESVRAVMQVMNDYASSVGGAIVWTMPSSDTAEIPETPAPTSSTTKTKKGSSSSKAAAKAATKPFTTADTPASI